MASKAPGFSEAQLQEFQECFGLFDKDRDGFISTKELGIALRSLGQYWTESELATLCNEIGNRPLNYDQFVAIVARKATQNNNFDDLLKAFRVFDRENTGFISVQELRHVLTTLGERLTDGEFDEILRAANIQPNSNIRYQEFVHMMKTT
eukprot:GDKI01029782.1.p1 GENE.GDKI01029782.1~~GDKI01029782.1.p1  ORF type:complete len:166 (+),score=47.38 GDKI01029782.1:50-499(+)